MNVAATPAVAAEQDARAQRFAAPLRSANKRQVRVYSNQEVR
jgi:hypothetical protein